MPTSPERDRRSLGVTRAAMTDALAAGRQRTTGSPAGSPGRGGALLALQREAGNAAVSALLAARMRGPGDAAIVEIDGALVELRARRARRRARRARSQAGQGRRHRRRSRGDEAARVGARGHHDRLRSERRRDEEARAAAEAGAPVSPLGKAAAAKPKVAGPAQAGPAPLPAMGATAPAAAPAQARLTPDKLLRPPVPPPGVKPAQDSAFAQVKGNVKGFAAAKRAHPPAASKAKEAQDAAVAPSDDLAGQAKAAKADTMDAQQPGTFDKKAFIAAVKTAIEAKSPKTLKEADDYAESGKAGEVKGEVKGLVTQGKEGSAHDIEAATEAPPDSSKAVAKPVTADGTGEPGAGRADPGGRRRAEAGPARAGQPRSGQARGRPGDDRRERDRRATREVRRAGLPGRARREADRSRSRRHGARRVPRPGAGDHRAGQGAGERDDRRRRAGHAGHEGRGPRQARRRQGQGEVEGRAEARRGHDEDPEHLHRHRDGRAEDPRRHRPEGRGGVRAGRGQGEGLVRVVRRGQDVGLQEGPVRRMARRPALGQGQALRHARQGQRVLRGRPGALPQADGRRDLARRRHRRWRPHRREAADRQGSRPRSRRT